MKRGFFVSSRVVLVEDDEGGDDAGHPAACSQQKHDENAAAPAVEDGQGREQDGEDDLKHGHASKIAESHAFDHLLNWIEP